MSALNAGIAAGMVHWKQDPEPQYLLSPAFFVTLARISGSGSAKGPENSASEVEDSAPEIEDSGPEVEDSGPEVGEDRPHDKEDRVRETVSQIAS